MEKSTLTDLLKTFSFIEIKEFKEFLKSGYFNKRQAVANLFEIISEFHPDYNSKSFTKENIFAGLFPGSVYNDSTLRVLTHYLTELAGKFLVTNKIFEDKLEYSIQLQSILGERKQYKLLDKEFIKSEELLGNSDFEAEIYYSFKYRLENEKTYQMFSSNYALYDKIIGKAAWENVLKELDVFYVIKIMIMYLNTISYGNLYNRNLLPGKFGDLYARINIKEYEAMPIVMIYYYLIKMMTDVSDETGFYKVKKLLKENKSVINKYDLTGANVTLGIYCAKKIEAGETKFERERFEIYRDELKEKTYLLNDNTMSPVFYRNIVISGLNLKEYSWVRNFVHKYKSELGKKYRDNYFRFCNALCEFHNRNFEAAMELNSKVVYDELYMKLNSKVLQIQLLYETQSYESLIASLESFRHFLSNNKLIPSGKRLQFSNFQKYVKQMLSATVNSRKSEAGILLKNAGRETNLISKDWLVQKLKVLSEKAGKRKLI